MTAFRSVSCPYSQAGLFESGQSALPELGKNKTKKCQVEVKEGFVV